MTPRFVRPCLALVLFAVGSIGYAQPAAPGGQLPTNPPAPAPAAGAPAPAAAANAEDPPVVVQLPDADLDTILGFLERLTGKIILRPAALPTATYNLKITKEVPRSAAIRYIETILALNGIGLVPLDERAYKVTAATMARMQAPELIMDSTLGFAPSGRIATKLFQLEFLRVNELIPLLQGVLDANMGGPQQIPNANAFLATDSITNLQRVETLLQQIDRPVTAGMKPKFYQLKHGAKASDLVTKLRTIIGTQAMQAQLGQATSYSADDRTNQIILITDPRQYPFFDELIEKLDVDYAPNTRNDVIHLSHAKAEEVVTVITRLMQSQTAAIQSQRQGSVRPGQLVTPQPAAPGAPGAPTPPPMAPQIISAANDAMGSNEFSGIMTVVNDNRTNSVVASGTADDIRLLRELVAKLDIVLAQVRIEIVIAEVSLDDQHQTGISALGLKLDGDKLVGFSGSLAGDSVKITNGVVTRPGASGHMDLGAEIAIASTPRKDNSTIFSVPAVVGSHGKQTIISNGEKRPIITGTVSSGQGANGLAQSSQITQQQIGTTLTVTPYIGADGSVQLDLKQTVEDVTGRVIIDGNEQPVIGSREITSYSTAKSGEVIVLGGFTKRIDSKTSSRLGPIPILGDIFGARAKRNFRQEILFFLRPTVLTNNPAIDNAPALKKVEGLPQRDEIKKQIDPNYQPPKPSIIDRILPK